MFSQVFTVALAAASVVSAAPAASNQGKYPDGIYQGVTYTNGTSVFSHVDPSISTEQFRVENGDLATRSAALGKRAASCYGQILNQGGVNAGTQQLKAWAGNGNVVTAPDDATQFVAVTNSGVQFYYCINAPGKSGSCSAGDVDFANGKMDGACAPYEAGHYAFDTSLYEIIGKAADFAGVCLGSGPN